MVAITERTARKDWEITAKNGDHFAVKAGKSYTTTRDIRPDGTVTVFANFWVRVPFDAFEDAPLGPRFRLVREP